MSTSQDFHFSLFDHVIALLCIYGKQAHLHRFYTKNTFPDTFYQHFGVMWLQHPQMIEFIDDVYFLTYTSYVLNNETWTTAHKKYSQMQGQ